VDAFVEMEETEDLFSLQMMDGTYYWDVVRGNVLIGITILHGASLAVPSSLSVPSFASKTKDLAKRFLNRFTRQCLVARAPKYLFITYQLTRRGSRLVDPISDPVYDLLREDALAIELWNSAAISYRDMLFGRKTRMPAPYIRTAQRPADLPQIVETVSALVRRFFGVSIDVHNLLLEPLTIFRESRSYYLQLFAAYRPKAVVCLNNGTLKGLFSAAKTMHVPTLELQHGEINSKNILWSYPESIPSSHAGLALPTALLTFSDYWKDIGHLPVRSMWSIGSDHFYQRPVAGDDGGILFVSASMHQEALMGLALELADLVPRRKIYFKLHPQQFNQKAAIVDACSRRPNIVVVSDEMQFPELLERCGHVIGIYSTTIFIALQAGKKICIFKRSNYFMNEGLYPYVELFDSASELRSVLDDTAGKYFRNSSRVPVFFQPFDAERFMQALDSVAS